MARIEISLEEYNNLKNRIKVLENNIVDISKEAAEYKEKLDNMKRVLGDVVDASLTDRIFAWKTHMQPFIKELSQYE